MHLPFFNKNSDRNPPREYIFSIEITSESVKTSIWSVVNEKVQVLAVGSISGWDAVSSASLITACDESLTDVTQKLDSSGKIQPEKVILGLPSNWVSDDKIHPDKLKLLKSLTKELSLKAVGFVITPQALVRYLHHTEGVPPTAILIGIRQAELEITLVRLGKIDSVEIVRRSGQIGSDVSEGLTRFNPGNMLPSRMLIYDSGKELEGIRQEMLSFAWQAPQHKLPFLHFPKIEILTGDFSIKAISQAGGDEVAKAIGLISTSAPEAAESAGENTRVSAEELGFFADVDIAASADFPVPSQEEEETEESKTPVSETVETLIPPKRRLPISFPQPQIKFKLPHLSFNPLFILIFVIGIGALLFWSFWYKLQADIVLTVTPKPLNYDLELTADPDIAQPDFSNLLLPASKVSTQVTAEKSKTTTGSKIVGDKATGSLTVINGTSSPRTFPAGTTVLSPSGLKFVLNTSVDVASASGTADPNSYQPGKASVNVTASAIGSDSNLSAGTQFRIGTFSSLDFVARNDVAFTGGTSRQVQAVSGQDLADLRSQLSSSLSQEAKTQLLDNPETGRIVIPESVTFKIDSEKPNHQVDEIADSVSLNISLSALGISISKSDLDQMVSERLSSEIPENYYQIKPIEYQFQIKNYTGQKARIVVNASTSLLPQLKNEDIVKNISGKDFTSATTYLKSLPDVSTVSLSTVPKIFSWIKILPHVNKNIRLTVQPSS